MKQKLTNTYAKTNTHMHLCNTLRTRAAPEFRFRKPEIPAIFCVPVPKSERRNEKFRFRNQNGGSKNSGAGIDFKIPVPKPERNFEKFRFRFEILVPTQLYYVRLILIIKVISY